MWDWQVALLAERRVCGVEEIRLREEVRALLTKEGLNVGKGTYISWDEKWGAADGLEEGNVTSDRSQIFSGFLLLLRHSLSGFLLGSLAPWRCDCVTSSQTSFGCFVSVCYVHFWAALSEFLLSLCALSDWSPFSLTVCTFPLRWWSFFPQHLVIHGQTPTSLHNCPWFLLPFFLLSGLVTWRNLRCFHVLLLLILHFFDPVISLKCPLDFVLSFPYMASWATSLLL